MSAIGQPASGLTLFLGRPLPPLCVAVDEFLRESGKNRTAFAAHRQAAKI